MKKTENSPNPSSPDPAAPGTSRRKRPSRGKSPHKAKTRKPNISRSTLRFAARIQRRAKVLSKRVMGSINVRLARLNPDMLKWVLMACGISAAIALVIIAMAKLSPLIVVLLAVLGMTAVLQMWARLTTMRFLA